MQIYFILLTVGFVIALGGYLLACLEEYESILSNKESNND